MKGVKLQYTEEQRPIMFEDVAGIGEAKVRCSRSLRILLPTYPDSLLRFTLLNSAKTEMQKW